MTTQLDTLLSVYDWRLLSLARRQFVMEAFKADLDRVSLYKQFRIRNDVVWLMLLDSRDMLVVQLASWAKGVYEPGGRLGQLRAHHARDLPRIRPRSDKHEDLPGWTTRRDREHADSFGRLFPSTLERFPSEAAFEELTARFKARLDPVLVDRSENRAHPYEKGGKGSAKMLDLIELRGAITDCERFMKDIRMVGCQSSFNFENMNNIECADVASDLVDMLLLGTCEDISRRRGDTDREGFYGRLHDRFESPRPARQPGLPEVELYFNDPFLG